MRFLLHVLYLNGQSDNWDSPQGVTDGQHRQRGCVDKEMIPTHPPGGTEGDSVSSCPATQNSMQLKTDELFISGMFHVLFSHLSWPQITGTTESETTDKREIAVAWSHLVFSWY